MPRKKEYDPEEALEKAMYVFWLNGYGSTSVRMLEKELGINQFSIYSSFESKHNLFVKVLKCYKQHMREGVLQILIQSDGELEDIRRFFRSFTATVQNRETPNGCLIANTAAEIGSSDQVINKVLRDYFNMLEQIFFNLLEASQRKGELSTDVNLHSRSKYLVTCTQGLSLSAKIVDRPELDGFISSVLELLEK